MELTTQLSKRDYPYFIFIVLSFIGGVFLMLRSRGFLLGYDVSTLLVITFCFVGFALPFIGQKKQNNRWLVLVVVPLVMRIAMFQVIVLSLSWLDDLEGIVVLALIATAEETFTAGVTNILLNTNTFVKGLVIPLPIAFMLGRGAWLVMHFILRPFDPLYALWLAVTGAVLAVIMWKVGLGAATLGHFLVNLTA